jgi:hypothetical protein
LRPVSARVWELGPINERQKVALAS